MPEFQDGVIKWVDCKGEFVLTAGEQQFFADKNFRNEPKRCKTCKGKRQEGGSGGHNKVETTANCSQCGRETTVPFRPTQGRRSFARSVFRPKKSTPRRPEKNLGTPPS